MKRSMVGTVAVVIIGASVAWPVAGAAADQIGTTKVQIAALENKVAAGAAQIHQLTLVYEQANLNVANLSQQIAADQNHVNQLQSQVSGSLSLLQRQVILSYTGATSGTLVQVRPTIDPSVGAEYLQLATGDIKDNVDQYRAEQRQLDTAEGTLGRQKRAGEAAAQAANASRQQLLAEASADQAVLNQLEQRLNQEIEAAAIAAARQRAAQAEAQVRARAASRAAAARAATLAAAAARPRPSPTEGLPVNNGLVTVVRDVLAAPAPPPSAPVAAAPPAPPPSSSGYTPLGGVWLELRDCESSDNYAEDTGNGFYGAYQFTIQTWDSLGLSGLPSQASPQTQDSAAVRLQAEAGWGQWPACSLALGLR